MIHYHVLHVDQNDISGQPSTVVSSRETVCPCDISSVHGDEHHNRVGSVSTDRPFSGL